MGDGFCLVDNASCSSYNPCDACLRAMGEDPDEETDE
jgi:hypothetical protein